MVDDTSPLFTLFALNSIFENSAVKCCEESRATLHALYSLSIIELSAICEV